MNIEFLKAKDGEITAKYNSLFLHSAYSPVKESQRYIDNLSIPFNPEYIIFIEPGLSYTHKYIKEKYPNVHTVLIRFSTSFDKYNKGFDKVFYLNNNLENELLSSFSEEELCSTFFLSWQPVEKAFPEETKFTWSLIKNILQKSKTVLVTREYFEKKWFLNTCNNVSKIKHNYILRKQISIPICIIASGPSLKPALPFLKQNQHKMFIICLSSAISCCLKNDIIPDVALSTDGGFWAGEHLKQLKKKQIPLILATEALCPSKVLLNNPIILLNYSDGLSNSIIEYTKINCMKGIRNGTVSGTALDFALENSSSDIYFFGLDLATNKAFSHTNPNENEKNNSIKDSKISPLEKRIAISSLPNESLNIYKEWFQNKTLHGKKVYRVIQENDRQNTLGNIQDISIDSLVQKSKEYKEVNKTFTDYFEISKIDFSKSKFYEYIEQVIQKEENLKLLFPLDYVSLNHNTGNDKIISERIKDKKLQILNKAGKLLK